MAGIYLDNSKMKISIQNWANTILLPKDTWEGNNLHIDEIEGCDKITRSEWIYISFMTLNIFPTYLKSIESLIPFLHFDLKYSLEKTLLDKLSLKWLKKNVSEYTPPSLNFTSLEYYIDFYEKELVACRPDNSILELLDSSLNLEFLYRAYFDEDERMYSREIYIFIK